MVKNRQYIVIALVLIIALTYLIKLLDIQVFDPKYELAAKNNVIRKTIQYPNRGLIYNRDGGLLVHNAPIYDLMVIPYEVKVQDTATFCERFHLTKESFIKRMQKAKSYSLLLPSTFIKQISHQEFAAVQDFFTEYPGFYVNARTVRYYPHQSLANTLGYIGEINKTQLDRDTMGYYQLGDYIGISGLEAFYEKQLRGKRGVKYSMVNAQGIEMGSFDNGKHDITPIPGEDLYTSIDIDLQQYGEKLMKGKVGAIVAIEPSSGEILALVSSPTYDPNLLSGKEFGKNFNELIYDSLKPIFFRPTMAMYPPGSMFKSLQALVALQEEVIRPDEQVVCNRYFLGDHAPMGSYDIEKGLRFSSNNFFYILFRRIINQQKDPNRYIDARIGLKNWAEYIGNFGLGKRLNIDLPNVAAGYIPSVSRYDRMYGKKRWRFSNIYSLSIGQGEMLVTPLQMANQIAIIANKGFYHEPHIVKAIGGNRRTMPVYRKRIDTGIDSSYFNIVTNGLELVVKSGTGMRANIQGLNVCGKTSTVENPHGLDHSGFMCFAPKENPQIAVVVYVENSGQGARAAAGTAGLMIEKYLKGRVERRYMEEYILKGDFIY